jgi:hypothetical protein
MLGTSALSEQPLSSVEPISASASAAPLASAEATASGVGALDASQAPSAFAFAFANAQATAAISLNGVGTAAATAQGVGRADREASKTGYAGAATSAIGIGRVEGPAIIAVAHTRVQPTLAISTEVLPLVVPARALVLNQPSAASVVLASTTEATSEPFADIVAASRVER